MSQRSKIIIQLIRDEISIPQALDILNLLLEDIKNERIKEWIDSEINGYDNEDIVPNYRIINAEIIGNIQVGYTVYSSVNIPIEKEFIEVCKKIRIRDGIYKINQFSISEKESEEHSLSTEMPLDYINSIAKVNGTIIHSYRSLEMYGYTNILNAIKPILLKIFKELEDEFGNLDDYYIDLSCAEKEEEITKIIINIIDNSITIGNENKIDKSNIGDNNENKC